MNLSLKKIDFMKKLVLLLLFVSSISFAQSHSHTFNREIKFPHVEGYLTLKTDLHIHTVFSDGSVWPDIRVQEAIKDGLDVISLTEHLEYQPHDQDIPHPNRNRSYELALELAQNSRLMIVHGSEITRSMPPGHSNAIFIKDANKMVQEEAMNAFNEAKRQGAFVFWNHPTWIGQEKDGISKMYDIHRQLIAENKLHGIEVVNEKSYSAEALQIALDNDLTIMGTSDVHGLIDWDFDLAHGGHRPITLVFAKERTETSLAEALRAGRTVVWYNNLLVGKEAHLGLLLNASIQLESFEYPDDLQMATIKIKNNSDAKMILENLSDFSFYQHADVVELAPHSTSTIRIKTKTRLDSFEIRFKVLNAIMAPKTHPEFSLIIK